MIGVRGVLIKIQLMYLFWTMDDLEEEIPKADFK
jgi:hypothetical protein